MNQLSRVIMVAGMLALTELFDLVSEFGPISSWFSKALGHSTKSQQVHTHTHTRTDQSLYLWEWPISSLTDYVKTHQHTFPHDH